MSQFDLLRQQYDRLSATLHGCMGAALLPWFIPHAGRNVSETPYLDCTSMLFSAPDFGDILTWARPSCIFPADNSVLLVLSGVVSSQIWALLLGVFAVTLQEIKNSPVKDLDPVPLRLARKFQIQFRWRGVRIRPSHFRALFREYFKVVMPTTSTRE